MWIDLYDVPSENCQSQKNQCCVAPSEVARVGILVWTKGGLEVSRGLAGEQEVGLTWVQGSSKEDGKIVGMVGVVPASP